MSRGMRNDIAGHDRLERSWRYHGDSWMEQGACRTGNYSQQEIDRLWDEHSVLGPRGKRWEAVQRDVERGKQICFGCPVREQCLAFAMDVEGSNKAEERYQTWGGLTPVERAKLAESRRRAS